MANLGVIGAGSWGIALSVVLADNGHNVKVWSLIEDEVRMLSETHEHKDKLPGVIIPDSVTFTTDFNEAINGKEMVVLAVPSVFIRSTAKQMAEFVEKDQLIVVVSKGIEEDTLMILSDIVEQEIPQANVAVLSGPSHAEEVGRHLPTTVVAGAKTKETAEKIQEFFMNQVFRVYSSSDILGIELGGSL